MTAKDYFAFIVEQIHLTVAATVDENGLPVTCVIDMMYSDESGLYFLTAKGKNFYKRLKAKEYIALSGMKGEDTMSCTAVSVRGKVKEIGTEMLSLLLERNPYMYPFWQMTAKNPNAVYACINYGEVICPDEIADRAIIFNANITEVLGNLV